jgi:hypothetical protein
MVYHPRLCREPEMGNYVKRRYGDVIDLNAGKLSLETYND